MYKSVPSHFYGCVTNFVFPENHWMLETLPRLTDNMKVVSTLGVHPSWASSYTVEMDSFILNRASRRDVVAIGEMGLCSKAEFPHFSRSTG